MELQKKSLIKMLLLILFVFFVGLYIQTDKWITLIDLRPIEEATVEKNMLENTIICTTADNYTVATSMQDKNSIFKIYRGIGHIKKNGVTITEHFWYPSMKFFHFDIIGQARKWKVDYRENEIPKE